MGIVEILWNRFKKGDQVIQKIKNREFVVTDMLTRYPKARDNDSLLLAYVWMYQAGGKNYISDITMWDFVMDFIGKRFAEVEPITRCRRKLQEKHPELRGELYEQRHQMKESVKEEIINWDDEQGSLFK